MSIVVPMYRPYLIGIMVLAYLRKTNLEGYRELIAKLGIRK